MSIFTIIPALSFGKLLLCKEKARLKRLMVLINGRQQIIVILNFHSINAPAGRQYKVDRSHISILRFDGMCCQQLRWNILIQKSSFLQAFPIKFYNCQKVFMNCVSVQPLISVICWCFPSPCIKKFHLTKSFSSWKGQVTW